MQITKNESSTAAPFVLIISFHAVNRLGIVPKRRHHQMSLQNLIGTWISPHIKPQEHWAQQAAPLGVQRQRADVVAQRAGVGEGAASGVLEEEVDEAICDSSAGVGVVE